VAALIAFAMISSPSVSLTGSIVPIQPRRSPSRVLMETKQPARALKRSGRSSGGSMTLLLVMKVSIVRRARDDTEPLALASGLESLI